MTTIVHDDDADLADIEGARVAVVGYGNQGRSWALNLRDSGLDVSVCVLITAVGVHRDVTGRAWERTLAVAKAVGGLRQGAVQLTPRQETVLDLGVEQALSPALTAVHTTFVQVMLEQGIPLEAVLTELVLSGEVERTMRLVRESGYAAQFGFHSPTSQYGQLTRRGAYDHLDLATTMRRLVEDITSGRFADEWDAERDAGYPQLTSLREQHAGPAVAEFETALREQLGQGAVSR